MPDGITQQSEHFIGIEYSDTYLAGVKLPRLDFTGADFTKADLREADLTGTDFTDVNFTEADLREAELRYAILKSANFTGADLRGANLFGADLKGANLEGTDIVGANLLTAKLGDVKLSLTHGVVSKKNVCFIDGDQIYARLGGWFGTLGQALQLPTGHKYEPSIAVFIKELEAYNRGEKTPSYNFSRWEARRF
jgi:hypothetical protein